MVKCCMCNKEKDNNLFSKNKGRKNGLNAYCKECKNKYMKEFRKKFPNIDKENSKQWYKKYTDGCKAHTYLNRAIKNGKIIKPISCFKCGKTESIDGHHPYHNYEDPYKVIWLCKSCHIYQHQEENC